MADPFEIYRHSVLAGAYFLSISIGSELIDATEASS